MRKDSSKARTEAQLRLSPRYYWAKLRKIRKISSKIIPKKSVNLTKMENNIWRVAQDCNRHDLCRCVRKFAKCVDKGEGGGGG